MSQNKTCPIKPDVDSVVSHSASLITAIRKFKRDLKLCGSCRVVVDCNLRSDFLEKVQVAIAEVQVEFDLSIS